MALAHRGIAMSKHTPGPWQLAEKYNCKDVRAVDGPYVADCNASAAIDWRTKEANARLIAAAPEMLIELRQAVIQLEMAAECIEKGRYDEALLHASILMSSKRAAIAKATGEA
jgi:hypothetical protein